MHGCAGRMVSSTKRISNWMDTAKRTGKSLFSLLPLCPYTPFSSDSLTRLKYWGRMHKEGINQKPIGIASLSTETIFENSAK